MYLLDTDILFDIQRSYPPALAAKICYIRTKKPLFATKNQGAIRCVVNHGIQSVNNHTNQF